MMMGILDRTRAALRPANSIEQATAPERPAPLPGADPLPPAPAIATGEHRASTARKPPAHATEPEAIARSYFVEERGGERRYYDDYRRQALAMRATATTIRSRREDLTTIRAMLTLAEARGWQALEVKGSKEFKREAWIEAHARGLEARGHRVSDPDRQEALRRRAERAPAHQAPANRVQVQAASPSPQGQPAPAREPAKGERGHATTPDDRRATRQVQGALSPEGQLVLAALTEKIDRQMKRHHARSTTELKAFVGAELLRKERAEGPVELSAAQRRAVAAPVPEPAREAAPPTRRLEPEAPRRTLSR